LMAPASATQYLLVGADVLLTVERNPEMGLCAPN
jgi:hypothetical protein